jgi:predicted Rossmann-fold nucleotide-binding protein
VVRASDAVIAVGGGLGTLSEIALALKLGRSVIGVGTFAVHDVEQVSTPEEAVSLALRASAR